MTEVVFYFIEKEAIFQSTNNSMTLFCNLYRIEYCYILCKDHLTTVQMRHNLWRSPLLGFNITLNKFNFNYLATKIHKNFFVKFTKCFLHFKIGGQWLNFQGFKSLLYLGRRKKYLILYNFTSKIYLSLKNYEKVY